jgi:hypothetical protein
VKSLTNESSYINGGKNAPQWFFLLMGLIGESGNQRAAGAFSFYFFFNFFNLQKSSFLQKKSFILLIIIFIFKILRKSNILQKKQ